MAPRGCVSQCSRPVSLTSGEEGLGHQLSSSLMSSDEAAFPVHPSVPSFLCSPLREEDASLPICLRFLSTTRACPCLVISVSQRFWGLTHLCVVVSGNPYCVFLGKTFVRLEPNMLLLFPDALSGSSLPITLCGHLSLYQFRYIT